MFRLSLYMNASEGNGKGLPGADTSERLLGEDGNYIKKNLCPIYLYLDLQWKT